MRLTPLMLAATAALALSAASARAQDTFETTSGNTYTGTVLSDDGSAVEIQTTAGAKMKLPYDSLSAKTQYRLQRGKTGEDARSQLALAEWCVGKRLYEQARTHFRKAYAADPSMTDEINAKVVVARKTAADELLARAKALQAAGQNQDARQVLSDLVQELPLEDAATEAKQMLADDISQRKKDPLVRKPKAAATPGADVPKRSSGEPFSDATVKLFQPVIDSYRKLLDLTQDGLVAGGSSGIKQFEAALKEADKIRKTADKLRPDAAGNEEIAEAIDLVDSKLEEASVDVRLNLVDNYLMRTSYNKASDVVKEGMVQYPKNERLRSAMNRVTAAAADGIGGDWVIVTPRSR